MSNFTNAFELETSTGEMLPFKGVHVNASLFGLLAIVELTQQWSNTSDEVIEATPEFWDRLRSKVERGTDKAKAKKT